MDFNHEKADPDDEYNDNYSEADDITNSNQNVIKQIGSPGQNSDIEEDYEIWIKCANTDIPKSKCDIPL